jgi:uncharacterized protein involved in type VI secretion and phage assembly
MIGFTGLHPDLLDMVLNQKSYQNTERVSGVWRARVVSTSDEQNRGRIQVQVMQLHEGINKSLCPWAEPSFPYGGTAQVGLVALPPVGATVWVGFELGFVDRPVWFGCWFGQGEIPDEVTNDQHVVLKTPGGHVVHIDDENDRIEIKHSNTTTKVLLEGGKVTIESAGDVEVNCTNANVEATGEVLLGAGATDGVLLSTFRTLWDTHTHQGNLGIPTGPPLTGAIVDGLHASTTVKAKP